MNYRNYALAGFAVLLMLLNWSAASAFHPTVNDRCIVHLDKSFYINGEVIWYKVYLPDIVKGRPVYLKAVMTTGTGRILDYAFLKTEGKTHTHGYYKIPFDITPGVYRLFIMGIDEVNRIPVRLAEIPVPIYSDEQIPATITSENVTEPAPEAPFANELRVAVELDGVNVGNRGQVSVRVKVTDASGRPVVANLSAAVTDWELSGAETLGRPGVAAGVATYPGTFYNLTGSLYTRYRLVNNVGEPLQANVLGAFSPRENKMYYTKTNADGVIFLNLPDFHGQKNLQFIGYDNEYEQISLAALDEVTVEKEEALEYTPGIIQYLNYSRQRKKIYQMYKALEFTLDPEIPSQGAQVLEEDFGMDIQEYERFENLAVFFREILTPLRFREVMDTTFSARMYNPRMNRVNNYFPGKPLFIIDGKVTRNGDFVAKLKPDYIQRINIIYEPAKLRGYFNVFGNNGVTVIKTDLPDIELPAEDEEDIVQVKGLLPILNFPMADPTQIDRHRPVFRPQLYWNPALETSETGEVGFSYFQSDDKSTFQIEVVAQGPDGAIGVGRVSYVVK